MTQEEIIVYNKLCAEFLGYKKQTWSYNNFTAYYTPFNEDSILPTNLKFHSDWDWIMEVVEKITSIELINNKNECNYIYIGFDYEDKSHYVNLYHGECNGRQINGYSKTSKKEAVVQAINQFLIWYNVHK